MHRTFRNIERLTFLAAAFALPLHAALSWPNCKDIADADFKVTPIVTRQADTVNEPMKMAFDLLAQPGEDAKGKVDVYFTERNGNVRKFDSRQNTVLTLGQLANLPIGASSSDGLMGIALDPAFKTNHWIYLYYSFKNASETSWRISRFSLGAQNQKLDLASEAVVLKVPMILGAQHPGGALQFDAYGDLWITTGNDYIPGTNAFPVWSSANTNDLRGKILRIHPTADGHYTIPAGNLFPVGKAKTLPEIYVMGTRNPYTLSLDPVRRWAVWGDVGPDAATADGTPMNAPGSTDKTEEHDLATAPGNYGYPFFAGANFPLKTGIDPAKPSIPANADWGTAAHGMDTLPPAIPAIHPYRRSCAITGPIYRYDGDLNSSIKFPPHFDRKWFLSDFNAGAKNPIVAITLSDDGKSMLAQDTVLKSAVTLYKPLDMQTGPDGALYVVNYSGYRSVSSTTGLIRIDYTGDCRPATPKLEAPISVSPLPHNPALAATDFEIRQSPALMVRVSEPGMHTLQVHNLLGIKVAERSGHGGSSYTLGEVGKPGIYFLTLRTRNGSETRQVVRD